MPKDRRDYQKAYREAHKEKQIAYRKKYDESHKEERVIYFKAYYKAYYQAHKHSFMEYRKAHQKESKVQQKLWRGAHQEQLRTRNQARESRKRNAFIEEVDVNEVYKRDRGFCGICRRKVAKADLSLDHILPLSKGGEHSYRNTQLAHRRCNSRKGNRATIPQQLRLGG